MLWYRDILPELIKDKFIFETFLITYIWHACTSTIKSEMAHDHMKVNGFTFSLLIKATLLNASIKHCTCKCTWYENQ